MKKQLLGAALSAAVLGGGALAPAASASLRVGGSTGAALLVQQIASAYNKQHPGSVGQYAGVGSGAGIKGAAAGTYDIGGSSRDPQASDPKGLTFTPISKESIVVVVNPKNSICQSGLTEAQVKSIFTKVATNWSQVGGSSTLGSINVFGRVSVSGTQASFNKLYLGGEANKGQPLFSNGAIRTKVAHDKSAIGFVTGAYLAGTKKICGVKIGGVAPTLRNTARGAFKYWNYQYLVSKGAPSGDAAKFIAFARSAAIQRKIVSRFAVPVSSKNAPVTT